MQNNEGKDTRHLPPAAEQLRILVVDDDENIREILKDFLNLSGHQVVLSSNGEEALQIFYKQEFDLVITDLGMPGISGWEMNRRIKRSHPDKPVVIITGWGAQMSEEDIKNSQVDLVLSKPFTLDKILEVTNKFTHKKALSQNAKKVIT